MGRFGSEWLSLTARRHNRLSGLVIDPAKVSAAVQAERVDEDDTADAAQGKTLSVANARGILAGVVKHAAIAGDTRTLGGSQRGESNDRRHGWWSRCPAQVCPPRSKRRIARVAGDWLSV